MRTSPIIIVALAVACAAEPRNGNHDASSAAATAAVADVVDDTAQCLADTLPVHASANQLVAEYLERDADGQFLGGDADPGRWYEGALACPGHTPGWDTAVLVFDWKLRTLNQGNARATYPVESRAFGTSESDSAGLILRPSHSIQLDTLTLARTRRGWRLIGFSRMPHVLPAALLRGRTWRPEYRRTLDSLVAAGARRPRTGA